MADNYGNSPKRKTYIRGEKMKIELSITNYVDDVMLEWINSRAVVTSAIWELVKKEAYREAAMNSQSLGVFNNHIQEVSQVNTVSQIEQTAYQNNQSLQINVTESADINKTNIDSDKISKDSEIKSVLTEDKDNIEIKETVEHADQPIVENSSEEIALTDSNSLDEGSNKKTDDSNSGKLDLTNKFKKKKKVSTLKGRERPLSDMEKLTLGIKD